MREIVERMIKENGEMWESFRALRAERGEEVAPVLITTHLGAGTPVFELSLEAGAHHPYWQVRERDLTEAEASELVALYDMRHVEFIGAVIGGLADGSTIRPRVRAYIKGGRIRGWNNSTEQVRVTVERIDPE